MVRRLACKTAPCPLEDFDENAVPAVRLIAEHNIYPFLFDCLMNNNEQVATASMGTDDFELLAMIGKGEFGEVRVCRGKIMGNVNTMKNLRSHRCSDEVRLRHVIAEKDLLAKTASNGIVKSYFSVQDE